jgi:uncharacterized protein (DUF1778 family)
MSTATKKRKVTRKKSGGTVMINIRANPKRLQLIDEAAKALGKNRSEFLMDVGSRAAEEALLDRRLFILNPQQWQQYQAALDAPPDSLPELQKLLKS